MHNVGAGIGRKLARDGMPRRVFYSFHYGADNWRASQIRNMGVIEGNSPTTDNDWEKLKRGGTGAIKRWIDRQLYGRSCTIVLIGTHTAGRKWVNYEIQQSWNARKALLGIYIHNLKDRHGHKAEKGANPFLNFTVEGTCMSKIVPVHDPFAIFSSTYDEIKENLAQWIEEAVEERSRY